MPVGRYKHVGSRFQQWRILPADCKSWIESRNDEPSDNAAVATSADTSVSVQPDPAAAATTGSATGRMGGDLPVNITEERLYRSRLCDLARERHSRIQESDYIRNQFIDIQLRKAQSKSLGRLLQGFDIEQYRNKSASGVEKQQQKSAHSRQLILATKLLGLSLEEASKFSESELRQRLDALSLGIPETTAEEATEAASPPPAPLQQRPSTSRTQPLVGGFSDSPSTPIIHRGSARLGSTAAFSASLLPRISTADRGKRQSSSYRARGSVTFGTTAATTSPDHRPRTASARRRVQSDPRYMQLINTLTPRYKPVVARTDVGTIIRANPSLCRTAENDGLEQQKQNVSKGRRTRREALEMLDNITRRRYYEAGNLARLD